MNKINNQFTSIEQITDRYFGNKGMDPSEQVSDTSFEEILRQKANEASGVKFSKHATMRLFGQKYPDICGAEQKTGNRSDKGEGKGN